jgi:hypothetical protein
MLVPVGGRWWQGKGVGAEYSKKMCTHVCKCKNDTCWNHSRNLGGVGDKENGGGVNSSMIYLIHYKDFDKCHNVPPPSTKIKGQKKQTSIKFHYSPLHKALGTELLAHGTWGDSQHPNHRNCYFCLQ